MSEAAPTTPPQKDAPDGAFFDPEVIQYWCWPELSFEFNEQNVFGRGLPTSPESRLRSVVKAIGEQAPPALLELGDHTVGEALQAMSKFLGGKVRHKPGSDSEIYRKELLVPEQAVTTLWIERLDPVRHPLVQAWVQVYEQNVARREHNKIHVAKPLNTIEPTDLDILARDLVLVLEPTEIRRIYTEHIALARAKANNIA